VNNLALNHSAELEYLVSRAYAAYDFHGHLLIVVNFVHPFMLDLK
jgi:hypothetical protein